MIVDINREDLYEPSPGTTVTAKVKCGRCSLGYSWFHEADRVGAEAHSLLSACHRLAQALAPQRQRSCTAMTRIAKKRTTEIGLFHVGVHKP